VSLEVKRDGVVVYTVNNMLSSSCPNHSFYVVSEAGLDPDEYKVQIHGGNALGVDYFKLKKNGSQIEKWGGTGGGGWCFSNNNMEGCWNDVSGASYPIEGLILDQDGSTSRIYHDPVRYRLHADCNFSGQGSETTSSRVSLEVKRGSTVVYSANDITDSGGCLDHTFDISGGTPDKYEVKIHGGNALGVDSFSLDRYGDAYKTWGANGGGGWCFSNDGKEGCWDSIDSAGYPIRGVTLNEDGSSDRIRFGRSTECNDDRACSSENCVVGGGSCSTARCCTVSIFKLLS